MTREEAAKIGRLIDTVIDAETMVRGAWATTANHARAALEAAIVTDALKEETR